ncbi:MAG TPA: ribosome maturation factor RimM [Virgibacillus sp.]|nr:ribosome maturation factor RimM [Virgibacillus sp.]
MTEKMFNVGKIINTHGILGEVKVLRISDFEDRFTVGNILYIEKEQGKQMIPFIIDGHRTHKKFDLLHFKDYNSINDVEHFKGAYLKISEEQLTDLPEDEFYYYEIIDCTVYTTNGEQIGIIKEILSPGANDVWVVKPKKGKDVLIPYIKDVVIQIDVPLKKIVIEPMEGLLD